MTAVGVIARSADDLRWMDRGSCRDVEPEAWYSYADTDVDYAKSFCRACPVLAACREWALKTDEPSGIWGGLTERERRALLKAPQATRVECAAGHPQTVENVLANGRCRPCVAEWAANSRTRHSKAKRYPCPDCARPIGLDRAGRFTKHLDMTTHTTCTGSWKTPVEVKA